MTIDEKLEELFIELPEPPEDRGHAVGALQSGKLLSVGGVLPFAEGRLQFPGRVGVDVRLDNARQAARVAAIQVLAYANRELKGKLSRIHRVVRVDGFVAASVDFHDHAKVIDGASELFTQVFGSFGRAVRTAVGASSLPQNACVELSVVFEVK